MFKKCRELDVERSTVGLELGNNDITYFCTPIRAKIIGWLGIDGVHFCFIPLVDENMVFAVSLMLCGKHHVEPIAYNFMDFSTLILDCENASPLE